MIKKINSKFIFIISEYKYFANNEYYAILLVIFISFSTLFLTSCSNPVNIAIKTDDEEEGMKIVKEINDITQLVNIASNANNYRVRFEAIDKIQDQELLFKLFFDKNIKDKDYVCNKITDQGLLQKIALCTDTSLHIDYYDLIRKRLNNPNFLAKYFFETKELKIKLEIIIRLEKDTLLFKILEKETTDKKVNTIYQFVDCLHKIKLGANYRNKYLLAIGILNEPEVINQFGEISYIKINCKEITQLYRTREGNKTGYGEIIECTIKLEKLDIPLFNKWQTNFPEKVEDFSPYFFAKVSLPKIIEPIMKRLPTHAKEKIRNHYIYKYYLDSTLQIPLEFPFKYSNY
jgi:hypothetical protein